MDQLIEACKNNDHFLAIKLLNEIPEINESKDVEILIKEVCKLDDDKILNELIKIGIDFEKNYLTEHYSIEAASSAGNLKIFKALFDIFEDREVIQKCFKNAYENCHTDIIDFLFEKIDMENFLVPKLLDTGNESKKRSYSIECILKNINLKKLNVHVSFYAEILKECIKNNIPQFIPELYMTGCINYAYERYSYVYDIIDNKCEYCSITTLMLALKLKREKIVEILIDYSDCSVINSEGETALIYFFKIAPKGQSPKTLIKLLEKSDPNACDNDGHSVFYHCLKRENTKFIKIIYQDKRLIKNEEEIKALLPECNKKVVKLYNSLESCEII